MKRSRLLLVVVVALGLLVASYFALRDPWDGRSVSEVVALPGGDAVTVESTYSDDTLARELTLRRVDRAGVVRWETTLVTHGGNIGDLVSETGDASGVLVRLPDDGLDSGKLVALSAETGAVLWTDPYMGSSYLSAQALFDGDDVWISNHSQHERRAAASGKLLWEGELRGHAVVAHRAVFANERWVDAQGVSHALPFMSSRLFGPPCFIGERIVASDRREQLQATDLVLKTVDAVGALTVRRWATDVEVTFAEIGSDLCGSTSTHDIVTMSIDSQLWLWGYDRARSTVGWTLSFGSDRLIPEDSSRIVRFSGAGALQRHRAVVVQEDNRDGQDVYSHNYRLDLIDLERGRVVWSLPLSQQSREQPTMLGSAAYQLVYDRASGELIVIDPTQGVLVKAVRYFKDRFIAPRALTDTTIWLMAPKYVQAYGYVLPQLLSPNREAPVWPDITTQVAQRIVHHPP